MEGHPGGLAELALAMCSLRVAGDEVRATH
jgi:hypothetical protein